MRLRRWQKANPVLQRASAMELGRRWRLQLLQQQEMLYWDDPASWQEEDCVLEEQQMRGERRARGQGLQEQRP